MTSIHNFFGDNPLTYTPCLKKNVPPLACYNFDTHEWIPTFFCQKCYQ